MKKLFFTMAIIAGAMFFTSCDETVEAIVNELTGNATTAVEGTSTNFSASMDMTKEAEEKANPYTIGLSMSMSINDLLNLSDTNSIVFPLMAYRITGIVSEGASYTVDNVIDSADVINFDYRSLFNGNFAGAQLVGLAVNKTKYYLMKTGTINITEVTENKVVGTFEGTAYSIDREADPMVEFDQSVPFAGSFSSRSTTMIGWILNMQSEGGE